MQITHLNLVAVMANSLRYPIAGVRPRLGEDVMKAVRRQHRPHQIVTDTRPWLLFCNDDESAVKWATTNRMAPERFKRVLSVDDVLGLKFADWQVASIGHWQDNQAMRNALTSFCLGRTA